MTILECEVYSDEFGSEKYAIVSKFDDTSLQITNIDGINKIKLDTPFAQQVVLSVKKNRQIFECNGTKYDLRGFEVNEVYFNNLKRKKKITKNMHAPAIVWIYKNKCRCLKCEVKFGTNSIENRKGTFCSTIKGEIELDVQFCRTCQSYYMDEESLKLYERKFGILLLEKRNPNDPENKFEGSFEESTVLSRHGYSARKGGPSDIERIKIMNYILKNDLAKLFELKEILSSFISNREFRFPDAARKW